jgi:phosphatidylserine decarboxylase
MNIRDLLFINLQKVLPHALLSRLIGKLADCEKPIVKNLLIKVALKRFNINLDEALYSSVKDYKNFNAFFTRQLKPSSRTINYNNNSIVSPCDGILTQYGRIKNKTLIQAKGKNYTLESLLTEDSLIDYNNFYVIYLSPGDYHRVHMPINGKLKRMVYVPGKLFSVNITTTQYIDNLFTRNERLICYFETKIGEICVIFVGAMLVAGIETVYQKKVVPNKERSIQKWYYDKKDIYFNKGEEIGLFNFGSTVICLFPGKTVRYSQEKAKLIKFGETLAEIIT